MPHFVGELNSQPATRRPASTASAGEKYQTNPFLLVTHCYKAAYPYLKRTRFQPSYEAQIPSIALSPGAAGVHCEVTVVGPWVAAGCSTRMLTFPTKRRILNQKLRGNGCIESP